MIKCKLLIIWTTLFLILPIFFIGCSGGEGTGSDSETGAAQVLSTSQVLPSSHDFDIVTPGNSPAPLEVKIKNDRLQDLMVTNIILSDTNNFNLDFGGGSNPCNSVSPTIGAGDFCTVEITFQPQAVASYSANVQIDTNDIRNPQLNCQLNGVSEPINNLTVRINQVDSDQNCPVAEVTAYVSVTDQAGYAVTGLLANDFAVYENFNAIKITDATFVSQVAAPISVALVMDYSGSITRIPELKSDMEDAVVKFVNELGIDDEAEIIKFAELVEVAQIFTSDKNLLTDAIYNDLYVGSWTRLYDVTWKALEDTAPRVKARKAVVIVSDGVDEGPNGPISSNSLSDVINYANDINIPIFTVGLGDINSAVLQQMADDTGGQYFNSTASDNLMNAYRQIANLLFENQYIIKYTSGLGFDVTADLTVEAKLSPSVVGEDIKQIQPCP